MPAKKKHTVCLIPKCQEKVQARGLCVKHYYIAYWSVKRGVVTWEETRDLGNWWKILTTSVEKNRLTMEERRAKDHENNSLWKPKHINTIPEDYTIPRINKKKHDIPAGKSEKARIFLRKVKVGDSFDVEDSTNVNIWILHGRQLGYKMCRRRLKLGFYRIWRIT